MKMKSRAKRSNIILTIVLALGCITVLFPLYMAVIIAFKSPSEMRSEMKVSSVVLKYVSRIWDMMSAMPEAVWNLGTV